MLLLFLQDKIFFSSMDRVKFKKPVLPGDVVIIEAELTMLREPFAKFKAKATVDGKVVCTGEFMAALVKD